MDDDRTTEHPYDSAENTSWDHFATRHPTVSDDQFTEEIWRAGFAAGFNAALDIIKLPTTLPTQEPEDHEDDSGEGA